MKLVRMGTIMTPSAKYESEVEGVLNPAAVRGPDGQLYLLPRLVGKGNYSRIGIARVLFDKKGDPSGVERMGIALEPETDYELRPGGGGCEDPRVTYFEPLRVYLMTYVAFSPAGPRVALAVSKDLLKWRRLGLAAFTPYNETIDFDGVDNKDSCIFPLPLPNPSGRLGLAILHRPLFPGTRPEDTAKKPESRDIDAHRECIWISYCQTCVERHLPDQVGQFTTHRRMAVPGAAWEQLKIGTGTPPVMTRHGWLGLYHGVCDESSPSDAVHHLRYSAGMMIFSAKRPRHIRYRSSEPILTPELPEENIGTKAAVVFPTGIDQRLDLGQPDRFDVYYGMGDFEIGVARLDLPEVLPRGGKHGTPPANSPVPS